MARTRSQKERAAAEQRERGRAQHRKKQKQHNEAKHYSQPNRLTQQPFGRRGHDGQGAAMHQDQPFQYSSTQLQTTTPRTENFEESEEYAAIPGKRSWKQRPVEHAAINKEESESEDDAFHRNKRVKKQQLFGGPDADSKNPADADLFQKKPVKQNQMPVERNGFGFGAQDVDFQDASTFRMKPATKIQPTVGRNDYAFGNHHTTLKDVDLQDVDTAKRSIATYDHQELPSSTLARSGASQRQPQQLPDPPAADPLQSIHRAQLLQAKPSAGLAGQALDTLFGFLLDRPEHPLYNANIKHVVNGVVDAKQLSNALLQPLEQLLQIIKSRCAGNEAAEQALLSAVQAAYTERIAREVIDHLGELTNQVPLSKGISLVESFDRYTIEINLTPVISVGDESEKATSPLFHQPGKDESEGSGGATGQQYPQGQRHFPAQHPVPTQTAPVPSLGRDTTEVWDPTVNASTSALVNRASDLSGDGLRVRTMSLPHRSKSPDPRAMMASAAATHNTSRGNAVEGGADIKQEPGLDHADASLGSLPKATHIRDHNDAVDLCRCLWKGYVMPWPFIRAIESKLLLQLANGNSVRPEMNVSLPDVEAAIKKAVGRGPGMSTLKRCDEDTVAACFNSPHAVAQHAGLTFTAAGHQWRLVLIDQGPHNTFICDNVPFGDQGVSLSGLLHSLLHLFDKQDSLRIRVTERPANPPQRWHGAVVVTLEDAQAISQFGFALQLRSGAVNTGIRHSLKFRPIEVVQARDCRVCGADDHKTDACPKLTAVVLDTPNGQHPRTRA